MAVQLRWALVVGVLVALIGPWLAGAWSPLVALGLLLAAWLMAACVVSLWEQMNTPAARRDGATWWRALARVAPASWGMLLAHVGVAVFVVGVTLVKGYETEQDVRMHFGDSVTAGPYQFALRGVSTGDGPNYRYQRAQVDVTRAGIPYLTLAPEKRNYRVQSNTMTEAAIDRGFTRDLYVSLGESIGPQDWTMRIYYKPFIDWIWAGCVLMALGGILAVCDRRYRKRSSHE
jgi:cytochrome c-type biogenesis protein CcmF